MSICIVTDSCADLPEEIVNSTKNLTVAPLIAVFGDKTYRDGVDIKPPDFYKLQAQSKELPSTGMVTPGYFTDLFAGLLKEYDAVIALLFSSKLSGTYNSALAAKDGFPGKDITVVDSRGGTLGEGLMALRAARMAGQGASKVEILKELDRMVSGMQYMLVLGTLDYLHKGGRLSASQKIIGNILNIKPILNLVDGEIKVIDRARGKKKAFQWIVDYIKGLDIDLKGQTIGINHTNCVEDADELERLIRENFKVGELIRSQVGAVVGTHAGPDALGIYFVK